MQNFNADRLKSIQKIFPKKYFFVDLSKMTFFCCILQTCIQLCIFVCVGVWKVLPLEGKEIKQFFGLKSNSLRIFFYVHRFFPIGCLHFIFGT